MILDLKPYPAMKDSGVPWLGEVPEHWEVGTLRRKLRPFHGIKIGPFGSQLKLEHLASSGYKVYGQANVIASDFSRGTKFVDQQKFDELSACEVRSGDLVVTMMGTNGRCARVPDNAARGIMDSHLLRLRTDPSIDPAFSALVLDRAPYLKEQIVLAGKGSIMQGLNSSIVKNLVLAVPPLAEQAAIVRFLDHADRRIRRYIRAKQKLIALLNEQKQAIIHRAVTRGLDPNVRLKPSGVEWLGDVPKHWALARLKDVAAVQTGLTLGKNYRGVATESLPYLRVANVQHGRVDLKHVKRIDVPFSEAAGSTLKAGDVLMTEGGDIDKLGRGCVWRDEIPGCLHQNHVFAVRCLQDVLTPDFLVGLMTSQHGRTYFQLTAKQTTNLASTNSSTLRALPVVLPPVDEQRAILDEVARQTSGLDAAIVRTENGTSFLREYRTRLIADVVTGKLDVREAAARLPEEEEEPEPLVDAEVLAESDEDGEGADLDTAPEEAEA